MAEIIGKRTQTMEIDQTDLKKLTEQKTRNNRENFSPKFQAYNVIAYLFFLLWAKNLIYRNRHTGMWIVER